MLGRREKTLSERKKSWGTAAALVLLAAALSGCGEGKAKEEAARMTGGNPDHGVVLIQKYGCSACHTIPGIEGARATIGPSLDRIGERPHLAGELPNTPENLILWITDPQSVARGTAMPDVGVSDPEARHIAAYLYTLK